VIIKIIGNPGSGKTTKLIKMIEEHLSEEQYTLRDLCVVSFTRAAVFEVKQRVIKFYRETEGRDLNPSSLNNIKTLHGFCYSLLGMRDKLENKKNDDDSDNDKEYNTFVLNSLVGKFMNTYPQFKDTATSGMNTNIDEIVGYDSRMNFNTRVELMSNLEYPMKKWMIRDRQFFAAWSRFCIKEKVVNFSSMLRYTLAKKLTPRAKVLFVDEAQDLTPLQLSIIKMWSKKMMDTYLIGDVNQSIFRFAGASPQKYEELDAESQNMGVTYRVPKKVFDFAKICLGSAAFNPVNCESHPNLPEGTVSMVREPDMSLPGSHMILCRTNNQLSMWKDYLKKRDCLWSNPYKADKTSDPMKLNNVRAIKTAFDVLGRKDVTFGDLQNIHKNIYKMPVVDKVKIRLIDNENAKRLKNQDPWKVLKLSFDENLPITGLTPEFFELSNDLENIYKIFKLKSKNEFVIYLKEKIKDFDFLCDFIYNDMTIPTLGTMHSVKGAEADHVWVDMYIYKQLNKKAMSSNSVEDDERRLLYVACTRAKKTLGLINRQHNYSYVINPILLKAIKEGNIR